MEKRLTNNQQIILASSSRTRIKILREYLQKFKTVKHKINEKLLKEKNRKLSHKELVKLLAREKAESLKENYSEQIIIGSDQILACESILIDKPEDLKKAKQNLMFMKNKKHKLFSSIFVIKSGLFYHEEIREAELFFKNISEKQIDRYLRKKKETILNSVGSYKIEENGEFNFVEIIKGDLETIMGFPIKNLIKKLNKDKI